MAEEKFASEQRAKLVSALEDANLIRPRLRLEELATLPLVPEFVELATEQPESVETRELETYLRTVLEAASRETGLARIALQDAQGAEILSAGGSASKPDAEQRKMVEAVVEDIKNPGTPAGTIKGYISLETETILLTQDGNAPSTTSSIQGGTSLLSPSRAMADIPNATRSLAIIAGLSVLGTGLAGAFLLRRRRHREA
ncbi:hypothetical protein [uncultured Roseibium sp.]|uniref:hypothetical protein n=1 Tax=uncultured Roseibium sp. TaxID=1936171 RepID=UPI0026029DB1|nr:hypothetical protein [uncultured Roseibium sp.]